MALNRLSIIIGGGCPGRVISRLWRSHLPEAAEYNFTKHCYNRLIRSGYNRENIFVHWANGFNTRQVNLGSGLFNELTIKADRFVKRKPQIISPFAIDPLDNLVGAANYQDISNTFDKVSTLLKEQEENKDNKKKNRLSIIISGNSRSYRGAMLWNEYLPRNVLTTRNLKKQLDKIPKSTDIKIIVDSRYADRYLKLTSDNTFVFSSNHNNISLYDPDDGGKGLRNFIDKYYEDKNPQIVAFGKSNLLMKDYSAMDSVTYYMDTVLRKYYPKGTFHYGLVDVFMHPYALYGYSGLATLIIILDPIGLIRFANLKLFKLFGKIITPLFKNIFVGTFTKLFSDMLKKTKFYHNWYIRSELINLMRIESDKTKTHKFNTKMTPLVVELDKYQKRMHGFCKDNGFRPNHYTLIKRKAIAFARVASDEEVDKLVSIYNLVK